MAPFTIFRIFTDMKSNHEIIKDAICEADPTVNRKNIIFENVYVQNGTIMAPYRELIWSDKFQISVEEYSFCFSLFSRESNLNQIGI